MSLVLALAVSWSLCRPADLACRERLDFDAIAIAEVPAVLPESAQCWNDGPCASPRLTKEAVERDLRAVVPDHIRLPDWLIRRFTERVEDYHHRCNQEIRREFAGAFSAGDFAPPVRDDYRRSIVAFFASHEGRDFAEARQRLTINQAAAPYDDTTGILSLTPSTLKRVARFLATGAGKWWIDARRAAWRRVAGGSSSPRALCTEATEEFEDTRSGAIVRAGLTDPLVYRNLQRKVVR